MARTSTLFLLLILVGLLSFGTMPACADSIPVASYAIYGTLSLTGGNACNGPCVETLTYSFTLDYFDSSSQTYTSCLYNSYGSSSPCYSPVVASPVLVSASGPLGFFGVLGTTPFRLPYDKSYYLPFFNDAQNPRAGDEIDLDIGPLVTSASLGIPVPFASDSALYACFSATCGTDFDPNHFSIWVTFGTAEFTATPLPVPEPSTLELLAAGMLAIGMFVRLLGK